MSITQVIMFIFKDKISLLEIINTSYFINDYKQESSKRLSENNESNIHIKKNNYVDQLNNPINKERELEIRQINNKIQVGDSSKAYEFLIERSNSKLKMKFFEKYFCLLSYSNDAKIYGKIVEEMKREFNINNILINFKRYDSFISNYYSKEGNILFESLSKKGYISSKCLDDIENIFNKVNENTNDKDKRLLDMIETMLF